jgi:hypothetical protein
MIKCSNPDKLVALIEYAFPSIRQEEPTQGKIVFRINDIICNIFLNTGTVYFQGKTTGPNIPIMESIVEMIHFVNNEN